MKDQEVIFLVPNDRQLYGNNVTSETSDLPNQAERSFIDLESPLPAGILVRYYIFISKNVITTLKDRRIRLQIWRPYDTAIPQYTLVFQQLVEVNEEGALYTVSF